MTAPSPPPPDAAGGRELPFEPIESPGAVHHPHELEVRDFSLYALILDLRTRAAFDEDHVPGAYHVERAHLGAPALSTGDDLSRAPLFAADSLLPAPLPHHLLESLATLEPRDRVLVYAASHDVLGYAVANALSRRGHAVDVMPGGYDRYRRWVLRGLEVMPRLLAFRVLRCSFASEGQLVLDALEEEGHQYLDVPAMAGWRIGAIGAAPEQPSQAWFESQLVNGLRWTSAMQPVWCLDAGPTLGRLTLPTALIRALSIAPVATMHAPLADRAARWWLDEPSLSDNTEELLEHLQRSSPRPPERLLSGWKKLAASGDVDALTKDVLDRYMDPTVQRADKADERHRLPPLVLPSLDPDAVRDAVAAWMPPPD